MRKILTLGIILLFALSCNTEKKEKTEIKMEKNKEKLEYLNREINKFAPVKLSFDKKLINEKQKIVLKKLIEATKIMDEIFLRQVYSKNVEIREKLKKANDELSKKELELFNIYYGPFNRLEHDKPFIEGVGEKPLGANFYPEDMTKDEFEDFLKQHPELEDEFTSNFTVIRRNKDGNLVAIPYSKEYKPFLEKATQLLKETAKNCENPTVKKYLNLRAEAFLSNDYFKSDLAWMDVKNNAIEVVIGPYEVYEDRLFGYKASFESFVTVKDPVESKKLKTIAKYLIDMEKNLPIPDMYKNFNRGLSSPIAVVYEVYCGGDAGAGVQTTAFNLPNDERVREAKGSKKVLLKNVAEAKYKMCWIPIAKTVLTKDTLKNVSFNAYFTHTLLHEISHGLGPGIITKNGKKTTVNKELKEYYSTIEEAKADVLGVYNGFFLTEKGVFPKGFEKQLVTTFIGGIFRSIRFGINEAHGGGNIIIFNYLRELGVINYDENSKKFSVNLEKAKDGFTKLAHELLILQATGDYEKTKQFVNTYKVIKPEVKKALEKLKNIPVDIRPIFPEI
ncbi:MutT/NUDIX family protein [Thermotomaculum hydrothermale]|uniref:MutT/NUDIX family protein n=1 Tax=Thermotomaculum hydrothermale TaxID=981385 RepID=A0A7R6SY60_9BACT|nr:hypothetical protein [Thermotomaculum hydrothermale]BBB32221.1 MutT/NUDIX family protein [Thermotomaculum hydrothermale]